MKNKGFSLTEVLISIALMACAIIVLIGVMISGLEAITKGSSYTEAATIAQSRMEQILYCVSEDYSALDLPAHPLLQDEKIGDYNIHVSLTPSTAYGNPYKKVTVEVKNTENKDRRKGAEVRLETIFTDKK